MKPGGALSAGAQAEALRSSELSARALIEATLDSYAFDFDGGNVRTTYQYNLSRGNSGGALLVCDNPDANQDSAGNVFRFNISQDDGVVRSGAALVRGVIDSPNAPRTSPRRPDSRAVRGRSAVLMVRVLACRTPKILRERDPAIVNPAAPARHRTAAT